MLLFHMQTDQLCTLCGVDFESHPHLFTQCSYVRGIFSVWPFDISMVWDDFLAGNVCTNHHTPYVIREMTFLYVSAVFYFIWKERNCRTHQSAVPRSKWSLAKDIKRAVRERLASFDYFKKCVAQDNSLTVHLF